MTPSGTLDLGQFRFSLKSDKLFRVMAVLWSLLRLLPSSKVHSTTSIVVLKGYV